MNKFLGNEQRFARETDNMGRNIFNCFGVSVKTRKKQEDTGNGKIILSL